MAPHARFLLRRSPPRRLWLRRRRGWLRYDVEESWQLASPGEVGAIEFWRLTWRQGPNY